MSRPRRRTMSSCISVVRAEPAPTWLARERLRRAGRAIAELSAASDRTPHISVPSPIISEAERLVHLLADELTRPREGECLCCYVARQLDEYPCDNTHRHAFCFRDFRAH